MKEKKKRRKDTAFLLTGTGSRTCLLHGYIIGDHYFLDKVMTSY